MKLSIIIPHHNGEELLYNCLQSLLNHISIQDFEIIVVDNGSTDNSVVKAKEKFPSINLLKSKQILVTVEVVILVQKMPKVSISFF